MGDLPVSILYARMEGQQELLHIANRRKHLLPSKFPFPFIYETTGVVTVNNYTVKQILNVVIHRAMCPLTSMWGYVHVLEGNIIYPVQSLHRKVLQYNWPNELNNT